MSSTDLSILIVDDLQFSRIVVKTALKKAGYNGVRMADSATEALAMLEQKPADVILADWMMPEMDGLELTQLIRQRDEEKGIYTAIILFTAHDGMDYLVKAFDHGVDDYLCKPPNPQELAARVNAAARIAGLQNDLLETSRQMHETIQTLKQMALVDELTGAGNLSFLMKNLKAHLLQASSRRGGVCLALIELRELNSIEISHGEFVVNEIVVSQYRRLSRAVRPTDIIARLDNNIFGIVMHHTKTKDYKPSSIERILSMINNRAFKTSAGNLHINGCIGVHYYRGDETIIPDEKMLKLAYEKLDQARLDLGLSIAY
jgi:phosphoserine phosphatase RsbU/P